MAIETVATATTAQVPTQETRVATQDGMNDATIVAAETEEEMVVVVVVVVVVAEEWVILVVVEILGDEIWHHHSSELIADGIFKKKMVLMEKLQKLHRRNL